MPNLPQIITSGLMIQRVLEHQMDLLHDQCDGVGLLRNLTWPTLDSVPILDGSSHKGQKVAIRDTYTASMECCMTKGERALLKMRGIFFPWPKRWDYERVKGNIEAGRQEDCDDIEHLWVWGATEHSNIRLFEVAAILWEDVEYDGEETQLCHRETLDVSAFGEVTDCASFSLFIAEEMRKGHLEAEELLTILRAIPEGVRMRLEQWKRRLETLKGQSEKMLPPTEIVVPTIIDSPGRFSILTSREPSRMIISGKVCKTPDSKYCVTHPIVSMLAGNQVCLQCGLYDPQGMKNRRCEDCGKPTVNIGMCPFCQTLFKEERQTHCPFCGNPRPKP